MGKKRVTWISMLQEEQREALFFVFIFWICYIKGKRHRRKNMTIWTWVKGSFSFHSFYFSLLFSFLIIYQREQPLSLFKRIKIFHLKVRGARCNQHEIYQVPNHNSDASINLLWEPPLRCHPLSVPQMLTFFKPVWNAKWKWHKRHCSSHAINKRRISHWVF